MLWQVFASALISALLHASWNAAAKRREKPGDAVLGIVFASALLCLVAAGAVGPPPLVTWQWMLLAAPLNATSVTLMRGAYDWTEYGLAYPLARGIIPPLLAGVGWSPGETLTPVALIGMAVILIAFVLFAFKASGLGAKDVAGLVLALLAGITLAAGLLCDRNGARLASTLGAYGIDYALASGFLSGLLVTAIGQVQANWENLRASLKGNGAGRFVLHAAIVTLRFGEPIRILRGSPVFCLVGGLAQIASFAVALWAYARGPVGLVAALRETNVLFAGLLARFFVGEVVPNSQWIAIGLTTVGAVLMKMG
jgi:drug/metabolite transporter (DMT)-like permease